MLNAKTKNLLSYVDQHCFPPESNSTPIPPIEPGSSSSWRCRIRRRFRMLHPVPWLAQKAP